MKNDGWRKVKGGGVVSRGGIITEARQKSEAEAVENEATETEKRTVEKLSGEKKDKKKEIQKTKRGGKIKRK